MDEDIERYCCVEDSGRIREAREICLAKAGQSHVTSAVEAVSFQIHGEHVPAVLGLKPG